MNIYKFEEIRSQLLELIKKQVLVPVLGAGFTRGEITYDNIKVPDGAKFKTIMIKELIKHKDLEVLKSQLEAYNFNQVSDYFFNEEFVSIENRKKLLRENFLSIKLPYIKKQFLNRVAWPYIYTFNIDNAIEGNSSYIPVVPYKQLEVNARDAGCVYKIHGDVVHEITYKETSSLIFSESQYIASLMKNASMLNFLRSDLFDNNLIFIGCRLESEIDLMYALSNTVDEYNEGAMRILVTRNIPENVLEEHHYKKYGINTIIQIDDYNEFYREMNKLITDVEISSTNNKNEDIYKINLVTTLQSSKDENLKYLLQNENQKISKNTLIKPDFTIERTILHNIFQSIEKNPITVVKGRRFSGKSYLILNIADKYKQKNIYYFPSTMKIDKKTLESLLEQENILILFDSNVLDQELAFFINSSFQEIKDQNNSVLVLCNNMEIDIANTFINLNYNFEFYYELSNRFNQLEITEINQKLSLLGIVEFKGKSTLLDNIYTSKKIYSDKSDTLNIDDISKKEAQILIILSVFDKVYTPVCVALGMDTREWNAFVEKFTPLLELVETNATEREQHSRYKIVVNSKVWLIQLLKAYHWKITQPEILSNIQTIIKTFKNHGQHKLIQQRVMMLDSLNTIMGKEEGSYKLMRYIYENLQDQLSDSPDYWLQRAKVIYKLEKYKEDSVVDAIDYAKKAFHDGNRNRTVNNAEFMVALLYGKLCDMQKFQNIDNIVEAITWFENAIKTHEHNKEYVNSMLESKNFKGGTFTKFCNYLETGNKPSTLLEMRNEITRILNYKTTYKKSN